MAAAGGGGGPVFPDPLEFTKSLGRISGPLLSANLLRNGIDLAFHNNEETDNLLYLDVTGKNVGIKTNAPSDALTINGTTNIPNILVNTQAEIGNLIFNTYRIQNFNLIGPINLAPNPLLDPKILTTKIGTSDLRISDKLIESIQSNGHIVFQADGTGQVEFYTTNVDVDGNLHATGDITFDGDVTFGDSNTDNLVINADVNSDIIPDVTNFYNLGFVDKRWDNVYVRDLISTEVDSQQLVANGINLVLSQGKTIYVSKEGLDENYGTHQQSTFKTIEYALSQAVAGDEVIIFPGEYYEQFPLTIPSGVTVKGFGIRSVTIMPTEATKFNDCFLLNGDTTVEFLAIKDFFYDSTNDTGYAFRFAPGARVILKSPYIQNVTVITQEVTSPVPLAAGRGALVDGSVVDVNSNQASMLFFSVTFIVPNADAITATNGTRVEWLNSFTYFAYRGIHLLEGTVGFTQGSTSTYTQGVDYEAGAIIWSSIAYGLTLDETKFTNPAAYADLLSKTTGQEWSISGSGVSTLTVTQTSIWNNYASLKIATLTPNPTIDSGWPAGNTNITSISYVIGLGGVKKYGAEMRSINSANVYGTYGAVANGPSTLAYLIGHNFGYIGTGTNSLNDRSIVIQANEVVEENNGNIYYDSVDHKGDYRVGEIFYVNQETGQVIFDAQSIDFGASGNITLEGPSSITVIDKTKVQTGNIRVHDNNVDSLNGPVNFLAQTGITNLNTDVFITGDIDISADVNVDGNVFLGDQPFNDTVGVIAKVTSDLLPSQNNFYELGSSALRWDNTYIKLVDVDGAIQISSNTIQTLTTNTDLQLNAATTGIVNVTTTNVQVNNDLTVDVHSKFNEESVSTTATASTLDTGTVVFNSNSITTKNNSDLELRASTGSVISAALNDVEITNNLTVNGLSNLVETNITGLLQQYGDYTQTGTRTQTGSTVISNDLTVTGETQLYDINVNNNVITTTATNSNLVITAQPTGNININNTNVEVENNLTVLNTAYINTLTTTGTTTSNTFFTGNITISENIITTSLLNTDLKLLANGVGEITVPLTDVEITNNLTVNTTSNFNGDTNVTGTITLYGLHQQTGDRNQTGSTIISNNLTVSETAQFFDFNITDNILSTTLTNSDLKFGANGIGIVNVKTTNVEISQDLTVGNNLTVNGFTSLQDATVIGDITLIGDINQTGNTSIIGTFINNNISVPSTLAYFSVPDIKILGNEISITASNTDLQFTANGNGSIVVDNKIKFTSNNVTNIWPGATTDLQKSLLLSPNGTGNAVINSTTSLVLPVGSNTTRTLANIGEVRFNNTTQLFEGYQTSGLVSFKDLYDSDRNTYVTSELVPGANDKTIRFGVNGTVNATINAESLWSNTIETADTVITGHTIKALNTATDLNIVVSGTGETVINNVSVQGNNIINNTNGALTLNSTLRGYVKFAGTAGVVIPAGTSLQRRDTPEVGETRWNTDSDNQRLETWNGTTWVSSIGDTGSLTVTGLEEITNFWAIVLG